MKIKIVRDHWSPVGEWSLLLNAAGVCLFGLFVDPDFRLCGLMIFGFGLEAEI